MMSKVPLTETVYTPDSMLLSPGRLMRGMAADLAASRELAWRLLVRNLSARYRQSILGYLWAFLPPLFSMAVWVFLNQQQIINIADPGIPYPIYVLVGTVLWQTFIEALNMPLKMVNESRGMLAKINFPREALILAGTGELLFNFFVRVILLVLVFLWFRMSVPVSVLLVPFAVLGLISLGLMLGLMVMPFGILYSDVGAGILILSQFWFFLTPVIYPIPQNWPASLLVQLNPVTPVLMTARDWLTIGASAHLGGFFLVTTVSVVLLLFGWLLYRIAMPHLIARMSA